MVRIPTLSLLAIFAVPAPAQTRVGPLLDAEGRPLEGGELRVDGEVVARTGADGYAELRDPELRWRGFHVHAPGHAIYRVGHWPPGGLRLPRGTLLVGSITDAAGNPVPDAAIRVTDDLATRGLVPTTGWPLAWHWLETRTDADGRFRLTGALAFGARVEVRIDGLHSRERGAIDAGTPVDVVVPELVRIRGRIVDATGEPVHGKGAIWVRDGDTLVGAGPTAPDGTFDLRVPAGEHDLEPRVPDALLRSPPAGERVPLATAIGTAIDLTVPLEGTRLTLRAMADGEPVPEFAAWTGAADARRRGGQRTDSVDGAIRISPLPAGTEFVAWVEAAGRGASRHQLTVPAADAEIPLELPPAVEIRGRVVDAATGAGIPRVAVQWMRPEEWEERPEANGKDPNYYGVVTVPDAYTDADGRFAIPSVGPGRFAVAAEATDRAAFGVATVTVDDGPVPCTIALAPGAELSGRLTGIPVGAWIAHQAERNDGAIMSHTRYDPWAVTTPDTDGRFRFRGLRRTAGRIEVLAPVPLRLGRPRVIASIDVPADASVLEADLSERIASVRGRVRIVGADAPLERLLVGFATREPSPSGWGFLMLDESVTFLDADGHFDLLTAARSCALLVVDATTRVILHRIDLELGGGTTDLETIEVALRSVQVRCAPTESLRTRVARIEVGQPWAYAGLGALSAPALPDATTTQRSYDTGNGVDLPDPDRAVGLLLPRDQLSMLIARPVYRSADDRALGWLRVEPGEARAEPLVIPLVDPDRR